MTEMLAFFWSDFCVKIVELTSVRHYTTTTTSSSSSSSASFFFAFFFFFLRARCTLLTENSQGMLFGHFVVQRNTVRPNACHTYLGTAIYIANLSDRVRCTSSL